MPVAFTRKQRYGCSSLWHYAGKGAHNPSMDTIRKITVGYDETEDRLRLTYQDEADKAKSLWLTQRLSNRLVGALLGAFDLGEKKCGPEQRAWELSAARSQLVPGAPVVIPAADACHLVQAVDLTPAANGMRLVFRSSEGLAAALWIDDRTVMHQWLDILHHQYRQAGWPQSGLWPEWFKTADQMAKTRPPNQLLN